MLGIVDLDHTTQIQPTRRCIEDTSILLPARVLLQAHRHCQLAEARPQCLLCQPPSVALLHLPCSRPERCQAAPKQFTLTTRLVQQHFHSKKVWDPQLWQLHIVHARAPRRSNRGLEEQQGMAP